jgi:cytochrome b561
MTPRLQYGTTAKTFHWTIVALLVTQYLIGWLMPDIHRGMRPGAEMTFHVSVGLVMLVLIGLRFAWRLTHPVSPESSLPSWQRLTSELVHWMLYAMVLLTTLTGWLFASYRGWSISFFYLFPFPMLSAETLRPPRRSMVCIRPPSGRSWCWCSRISRRLSSTCSTIAIASSAACYRAKVGVERVTFGWQSGR